MSGPLGIEFDGALHHVTARANRGEAIREDDGNRWLFVDGLGDVVDSFDRRRRRGYVDNPLPRVPHIPTAQQQIFPHKFNGRPQSRPHFTPNPGPRRELRMTAIEARGGVFASTEMTPCHWLSLIDNLGWRHER